ncbi:peptidoglycan-binding protein [Streptomyces sp. NPDC058371]|uniref:peptidoglycan-binding domain-containing protein n=1 Tax=Streptomyces sp. NPDC058371 TaxID=3346463 RepID=UPI00364EBB72
MSGPKGPVCPECGTHREPDGTPSCACTQRASDALRDARTADAAAAEDFDPLRIRPYVDVGGTADADLAGPPHADLGGAPHAGRADRDETGRGEPARDETGRSQTARDETRRGESARTMPLPRAMPGPEPEEVRLPQEQGHATEAPGSAFPPSGNRPRRRRRIALVGAAGAVVGVLAAAGFATGLLSYDSPERDGALPDAVRESVPEESPDGTASAPASRSASPTAPARETASAGGGPSPSASSSGRSAKPSRPATPTEAPPTARATGSIGPPDDSGQDKRGAQVLRPGDQGPEVTELQLRLTQLALYIGTADGTYDSQVEEAVRRYQVARGITTDEQGVYGPSTRTSLESETTEP